jgi:hypothetical protein
MNNFMKNVNRRQMQYCTRTVDLKIQRFEDHSILYWEDKDYLLYFQYYFQDEMVYWKVKEKKTNREMEDVHTRKDLKFFLLNHQFPKSSKIEFIKGYFDNFDYLFWNDMNDWLNQMCKKDKMSYLVIYQQHRDFQPFDFYYQKYHS